MVRVPIKLSFPVWKINWRFFLRMILVNSIFIKSIWLESVWVELIWVVSVLSTIPLILYNYPNEIKMKLFYRISIWKIVWEKLSEIQVNCRNNKKTCFRWENPDKKQALEQGFLMHQSKDNPLEINIHIIFKSKRVLIKLPNFP